MVGLADDVMLAIASAWHVTEEEECDRPACENGTINNKSDNSNMHYY
jgi:hypothetical protein